MKIIVFSDTHLTTQLNPGKFDWIKRRIAEADQIIINGDFWEGYLISFDQFVNSPWSEIFPLLKSKNTVYIYGNHDPQEDSDQRVSLFSTHQAMNYQLDFPQAQYHIEHGHLIVKGAHRVKEYIWFPILLKLFLRSFNRWEALQVALFGQWIRKVYVYRRLDNQVMRRRVRKMYPQKTVVVGHSHQPTHQQNFINTGDVSFGGGYYLVIDTSNNTQQLLFDRFNNY